MKPEIITRLEKELNYEFEKVDISEIMKYSNNNKNFKFAINENAQLIGLCINGSDLQSVPSFLPDTLLYLNLYNNKIDNISAVEKLHNLTKLELSKNIIKTIPAWIYKFLKMDNLIYFYDNPLESPPP